MMAERCWQKTGACSSFFRHFLESRWLQDLYADETGYGECPDGSTACIGMIERDASLEECLHIISTAGYASAYPSAFGATSGSQLAIAIETLYSNCEFSFSCHPLPANNSVAVTPQEALIPRHWGRPRLRGHFSTILGELEPAKTKTNCTHYVMNSYGPQWVRGSCDGYYHYADTTCGYSCLITEGFYWSLTSLLGAQNACGCQSRKDEYRCCAISHEWQACTLHEMRSIDLAAAAYKLLSGLDPSRQLLGYVLPTRLPDGRYRGHQSASLNYSCRAPKDSSLFGCPNGSLPDVCPLGI